MNDKYGSDTFRAGTLVKSESTGLKYLIESRDEDTLDGQQVYIVRSVTNPSVVFPVPAGLLTYMEEA